MIYGDHGCVVVSGLFLFSSLSFSFELVIDQCVIHVRSAKDLQAKSSLFTHISQRNVLYAFYCIRAII